MALMPSNKDIISFNLLINILYKNILVLTSGKNNILEDIDFNSYSIYSQEVHPKPYGTLLPCIMHAEYVFWMNEACPQVPAVYKRWIEIHSKSGSKFFLSYKNIQDAYARQIKYVSYSLGCTPCLCNDCWKISVSCNH